MSTKAGARHARLRPTLLFVGVIMLAIGVHFLLQPQIYEARAVLRISSGAAGTSNTITGTSEVSHTLEAARVKSTTVLARVAERLALAKRWRGTFDAVLSREELLTRLRERIRVTIPDGSNTMELAVWSHDGAEAAEIANALAERYMEVVADSVRRVRGETVAALRQNLAWQTAAAKNLRKRLEELRAENQLRQEANPATAVQQQPPPAARVYELAAELARIESNLILTEAKRDELRGMDSAALREALCVVFPNELVLPELLAELNEVLQQIEALRAQEAIESEQLENLLQTQREIEERIDHRVSELMAAIEGELQELRTKSTSLKSELQLARMPDTQTSELAASIAQLERELQIREKTVADLENQILQEEVHSAATLASHQPELVEPAQVPVYPLGSKRPMGLILCVSGGGLVIGSRFLGYRDKGKTAENP